MKFKFKITAETTLQDVLIELENLENAKVKEIPLNHIRKIMVFLGIEEISGRGSSVRFQSGYLASHPYYHEGIFQVHKIHKGGKLDKIKKSDYVKYLLPALKFIIEQKMIENERFKK